jgi:hypothetical protein
MLCPMRGIFGNPSRTRDIYASQALKPVDKGVWGMHTVLHLGSASQKSSSHPFSCVLKRNL